MFGGNGGADLPTNFRDHANSLAIPRRRMRDIECSLGRERGKFIAPMPLDVYRCNSGKYTVHPGSACPRGPERSGATARAGGPIVSNLAKELVQTSGITFPSKSLSCHQSLNEALNIETTGLQRTGNCLKEILGNVFEAPLNIQGSFPPRIRNIERPLLNNISTRYWRILSRSSAHRFTGYLRSRSRRQRSMAITAMPATPRRGVTAAPPVKSFRLPIWPRTPSPRGGFF